MISAVMGGWLNVSDVMFKTKRILAISASSKRSGITRQKILPFLKKKKDKLNGIETQFSDSHPPSPPRTRPFLHSGFSGEQTLPANNNDPESFHCAMGPILVIAQLFGVLPVSGICKPSPSQLKFEKFSFRTIYTVFINALVLVMAILAVIHMITTLNSNTFQVKGGVASATAGAIFYTNSVIGLIIFFWLAPRWVTLQRDWRSMEQFIDSNKMERPKLRWKFYVITASILLMALAEHILSILVNTTKYDWSGRSENSTFQNFLQIYCMSSHAFIMKTLRYNLVLGIFIFIASKLATFTWNFTDVFVMLVATGLAERYKMLNKLVVSSTSKQRTIDWCGLREDYAALSCLVKKVDNNVAPIILLSFANNLYFICLQLLNELSKPENDGIISDIYFFGSFVFLIGRTVTVTLLAARIYDQSKEILPLLYTCSASAYNVETERLIYLLSTDDIMLTGMRFFSITRSFMLAVTGAIVTYEVVLLQFNISNNK
ncbi:PREDICTED: gustatory receptor for sugar taste 64e-like [Vollenhovia emeryi]|uniref:gustatory receptor for sugar taste 64e-like n=1 Tax=Vollenhovia emeryi TaxID=411798 RepID=UPI0005F4D0DD|nr:PREDICTED: gustatory receptor for sugar taste 64e-like [Vollenhovia emeryi]